MVKNPSWLEAIKAENFRHARPLPDKTALLVIDMQKYFGALAAPILDNVLSLIETCRKRGVKIVFTRHGHRDPATDGGMLRVWWGDLIEFGSAQWQFMPRLNPLETETVIDKNRYSAFFKTGMEELLHAARVEDVIICGVMTNCCCETTARDAFVRDYRVFFVADATATVNRELHLASLKNLAYGFAYIVASQDMCERLERS